MKNSKIAYIVERAKKKKEISAYEITTKRSYINMVIKYIRDILKESPEISKEELKYIIINELSEELREYCDVANVRGRYFQYEAQLRVVEDRRILEEEYAKIKDDERYKVTKGDGKPKVSEIYNASFKSSCRKIVVEGLIGIRDIKANISESVREMVERYNKANEKEKRSIEKRFKDVKEFRNLAKLYEGLEVDGVYNILKQSLNIQEEELKEVQIAAMEHIFGTFKRFGLLDRYKTDNDRNMSKYGLSDYTYEVSTGKFNIDDIGIEELFSRDFLKTQDLEDVIMLSTFWQNRYAKEIEGIGEAIFSIDTLDLWEDIIKGKNINISDEQIEGVANKAICVRDIVTSLHTNLREKNKVASEEEVKKGYKMVYPEKEIQSIVNQEGERYRKIFDSQLESSQNDLEEDMETYRVVLNHVENIYTVRNSILACRIRSLIDSKKCKNWGIIQDEIDTSKKNRSDNYVLIGIDYEGFNMPVRLHIKKDLLKDILITYNGETKVPIYEGDKDFVITNELIPTNILMPLQKRQKKVINKRYNELDGKNTPRSRLIRHLKFIKDQDKYPEHLKREIHTASGIKRVRPPRRYYDLLSGETYIKENGEYVILPASEGRGKDER